MVDWIIFDLNFKPKNLEEELLKIVNKYKPYVNVKNNSIYAKVEKLRREEREKLEKAIKGYLDDHIIPYDVEYVA